MNDSNYIETHVALVTIHPIIVQSGNQRSSSIGSVWGGWLITVSDLETRFQETSWAKCLKRFGADG